MEHIVEKKDCTGCMACGDACPVNAISYEYDNSGFWYPIIDENKCIDCGKCKKICPSVEYNYDSNDLIQVYQAWSKDDFQRKDSTSGGVFWEIAKRFIEEGGIVIGCQYGDNWKSAHHSVARSIEELEKLKGSKYFQSNMENIYKIISEEVVKGTTILFCGTPCQCAAIRNYLGKEYSNIFYLDFICRSINSPKAFEAYITELEEKYHSKVSNVHLKDKRFGWHSLATRVTFENGEESYLDKSNDPWVRGFIYSDLYTRDSCYECKYRSLPRKTADITIGDFWGIKGETIYDNYAGISVVIVNNSKGQHIISKVKNDLLLKQRSIEEVIGGNPALKKSPNKLVRENNFFELLKEKTFSEIAIEAAKPSFNQQMKWKRRDFLVEVKRIYKFIKQGRVSIPKYLYWNYMSNNVIRYGKAKLVPNKNTVLDIDKSAKIILRGDQDVIIGYNKLLKSKSETHIRMEKNSCWKCNHGANIFYNTVLEIKPNALLETGFFTMNGGSVVIADKHIVFGEDVMLGRNVVIYDSDFHQILNEDGEVINGPQKVTIEDHVWLTSNVTVLKGVTIGQGSLVAAQTVINKDMPEHSIIGASSVGKVKRDEIVWSRKRCN